MNPPSGCSLTLISVLALLLLCTGCESQLGVKIGEKPPGFSSTDIHGDHVSLSQLKGKVVVIYFWENSCCGGSLKQLQPFYRQYKDNGLQIIAINELGSKQEVASYARNNALTFTMLTDEYSMLFKIYRVFGFPTVFILDRNGIVREKILGDIQTEKLEQLASGYLDDKSEQKRKETL